MQDRTENPSKLRKDKFAVPSTTPFTSFENPFDTFDSELPSATNQKLFKASEFYRTQPVLDRRVHLLGVGATGRFVAHSLRGLVNPPPVTLVFHSARLVEEWNKSTQELALVTDGHAERSSGYDIELAHLRLRRHGQEFADHMHMSVQESADSATRTRLGLAAEEATAPISSLIVCTRTTKVLQALSAVKHRLSKDSVILFLTHGMGTVEEVNREIFPDPESRPRYMLGINTHEIHAHEADKFTSVWGSRGTLALGLLPHERERAASPYAPIPKFDRKGLREKDREPGQQPNTDSDAPPPKDTAMKWTPTDRHLLRTLLRSPSLCATGFSPPDLLQLQLEKLAVQCIIGPLTTMLDARNGALLYNYALTRTMRLLLSEISLVIRSLPELAYIPNIAQRFDPGRLETMVVGVANKTRDDVSKMLQDVRKGRETDVRYANGWIVKRGEELGVRCFMNYMMMEMVKGKSTMVQMEVNEDLPFAGFEGERAGEGGIRVVGERVEDD